MEEIHTLAYFGKGGYSVSPWDLTGKERDWLLDRLSRQYKDEAREFEREMAKAARK